MIACRRVGLTFGFALGLSLAGCGGGAEDDLPRQAISGNVTLNDKPLERGSIMFNPVDSGQPGAVAVGAMISDGTYSIARVGGPTPGNYRVAILDGGDATDSSPDNLPGRPPKRSAMKKSKIPERYNVRSDLKAEVKAETPNTFNFELKSQ